MSRTDYLTLGIVVVCIAALAFLIFKIVSLPDEEAQAETQLPMDRPGQAESDTSAYYTYDTEGDYAIEADTTSDDIDDDGDFSSIDEAPDNSTSKSGSGISANPEPVEKPVVSEGAYMVLAGSFKIKSHAETAVRSLQKKGYANASVQIFDRGKYAVALVDRFNGEAEAEALKEKLRQQGIEAQVYKKR
jgi:cell division protein FtsN